MWIWLSWSIRRKNNKSDIYVFMVDNIYVDYDDIMGS